jgi:predicted acylesterase/phospholipase RssA
VGVAKALGDGIKLVTEVSGASVGAITAALFAWGFTSAEIEEFLRQNDFSKVFRHIFGNDPHQLRPHINKAIAIKLQRIISGNWKAIPDQFKDSILINLRKRIIRDPKSAEITFEELELLRKALPDIGLKKLFITATTAEDYSEVLFSAETTPKVPISFACAASAALPLVFKPVQTDEIGAPHRIPLGGLIDGNMSNNCPWQYLSVGGRGRVALFFSKRTSENLGLASIKRSDRVRAEILGHPLYPCIKASEYVAPFDTGFAHTVSAPGIGTLDQRKALAKMDEIIAAEQRAFEEFIADRNPRVIRGKIPDVFWQMSDDDFRLFLGQIANEQKADFCTQLTEHNNKRSELRHIADILLDAGTRKKFDVSQLSDKSEFEIKYLASKLACHPEAVTGIKKLLLHEANMQYVKRVHDSHKIITNCLGLFAEIANIESAERFECKKHNILRFTILPKLDACLNSPLARFYPEANRRLITCAQQLYRAETEDKCDEKLKEFNCLIRERHFSFLRMFKRFLKGIKNLCSAKEPEQLSMQVSMDQPTLKHFDQQTTDHQPAITKETNVTHLSQPAMAM